MKSFTLDCFIPRTSKRVGKQRTMTIELSSLFRYILLFALLLAACARLPVCQCVYVCMMMYPWVSDCVPSLRPIFGRKNSQFEISCRVRLKKTTEECSLVVDSFFCVERKTSCEHLLTTIDGSVVALQGHLQTAVSGSNRVEAAPRVELALKLGDLPECRFAPFAPELLFINVLYIYKSKYKYEKTAQVPAN